MPPEIDTVKKVFEGHGARIRTSLSGHPSTWEAAMAESLETFYSDFQDLLDNAVSVMYSVGYDDPMEDWSFEFDPTIHSWMYFRMSYTGEWTHGLYIAYVEGGGGTGPGIPAVTSVSAGAGMDFETITGTGDVIMGTPTGINLETLNVVEGKSHTHELTLGIFSQYAAGLVPKSPGGTEHFLRSDATWAEQFWKRTGTVLSPQNVNDSVEVDDDTDGQSVFGSGLIVNNLAGSTSIYDFTVKTLNYTAINVVSGSNAMTLMSNPLGNVGFFGVSPSAQSTGWAITNEVVTKILDANVTTINELADVVGSIIEELKTKGILGS